MKTSSQEEEEYRKELQLEVEADLFQLKRQLAELENVDYNVQAHYYSEQEKQCQPQDQDLRIQQILAAQSWLPVLSLHQCQLAQQYACMDEDGEIRNLELDDALDKARNSIRDEPNQKIQTFLVQLDFGLTEMCELISWQSDGGSVTLKLIDQALKMTSTLIESIKQFIEKGQRGLQAVQLPRPDTGN